MDLFSFPGEDRGGHFPLRILRSLRSFPRPPPGQTGGRRTWRPGPGRSRPGPDGTGAQQVGTAAGLGVPGAPDSPHSPSQPGAGPGRGPSIPAAARPGLSRCRGVRDGWAGSAGAAARAARAGAEPCPRPAVGVLPAAERQHG